MRGRAVYDWDAIRKAYELGATRAECQKRFGFSAGAWYHAIARGVIRVRAEEPSRPAQGETRGRVAELVEAGLNQAEIASALHLSRPTVCFHMRNLGVAARVDFARRFDWSAVRAYYEDGHSFRQCQKRFGFSRAAWADAVRRGAIETRPRLEPIDQILVAGRKRSRSHVKARLLVSGLKVPRCEGCGLGDWRGDRLPLELHHVNGDGLDNRLENLRLLCPNCHSQTDTWGGRNKLRHKRGDGEPPGTT